MRVTTTIGLSGQDDITKMQISKSGFNVRGAIVGHTNHVSFGTGYFIFSVIVMLKKISMKTVVKFKIISFLILFIFYAVNEITFGILSVFFSFRLVIQKCRGPRYRVRWDRLV